MTREAFLSGFFNEALRTVRLVRVFEDADLAIRPGSGSMSTAEQIDHIAASHNFIRGLFEDEDPSVELFQRKHDVSTVLAAVRTLSTSIGEVRRAVLAAPDAKVAAEIAPFGPAWKRSRLDLALLMVGHEVHHRGQLHVYARVAGRELPLLYAPVDELVLEF